MFHVMVLPAAENAAKSHHKPTNHTYGLVLHIIAHKLNGSENSGYGGG